jgi:hypothetical protein
VPRLRIDQLMALCWQILLPFVFLQIIINGLVLVYDWPSWTMTILSGAAAIAMGTIIYKVARRSGVLYQTSGTAERVGSVL